MLGMVDDRTGAGGMDVRTYKAEDEEEEVLNKYADNHMLAPNVTDDLYRFNSYPNSAAVALPPCYRDHGRQVLQMHVDVVDNGHGDDDAVADDDDDEEETEDDSDNDGKRVWEKTSFVVFADRNTIGKSVGDDVRAWSNGSVSSFEAQ